MRYFFQNNAVPHVLEIEKYAVNMRLIFVNMWKYAVDFSDGFYSMVGVEFHN